MIYRPYINPQVCPGHKTCIWFCARTQTCDFCYITHKRRGCEPDELCTRYLPLSKNGFKSVKQALCHYLGRKDKKMTSWLDRNLDVTLTAAGQPPEDEPCRCCDKCGEPLEDTFYEGETGFLCAACVRDDIENAMFSSLDQIAGYCGFRVCHGETDV